MGEQQLHIMLFPFIAAGHLIPTLDMAKLFSSRENVKITLVITPRNAPKVPQELKDLNNITFKEIPFPDPEAGIPPGYETVDKITDAPELFPKFLKALELMQNPLEKMLKELAPNCLVADMFYPWATNTAAKFDIPRLVFHGIPLFALCASEVMRIERPFQDVSSDTESFVIPNLPHEIAFTKLQLSESDLGETETDITTRLMKLVLEADKKSYGILVNSFLELEPDYTNYYKTVFGRRAWQIGPLLLSRRQGKEVDSSGDDNECLRWLDGKKKNSVIYLCFGSVSGFTTTQMQDIALGLEASGQQFIWAVRKEDDEKWLPEGFEERMNNKGLIIRGWAPQVPILEHEAVGAFVTHCGWNSILEAICAGVPMVTWPLFAEQFYNEKFVTKIARIGIAVGSPKWGVVGSGVSKENIAKALIDIMEGDQAIEIRDKASEIKKMAWQAVEKNGSSYNELSAFIEEMRRIKCSKQLE